MACGCNQNWNQGCNRPTPCEQAIRQIERDAVELFRQLEEAERGVCKLKKDIEMLHRYCHGHQPMPRPCGCGCGCRREREVERGCGYPREMEYEQEREQGYGRNCGCK